MRTRTSRYKKNWPFFYSDLKMSRQPELSKKNQNKIKFSKMRSLQQKEPKQKEELEKQIPKQKAKTYPLLIIQKSKQKLCNEVYS